MNSTSSGLHFSPMSLEYEPLMMTMRYGPLFMKAFYRMSRVGKPGNTKDKPSVSQDQESSPKQCFGVFKLC